MIGFNYNRATHAEYVLTDADHIVYRPVNVSWEQGVALSLADDTALALVKAVLLKPEDTVVVSGGVGWTVVN